MAQFSRICTCMHEYITHTEVCFYVCLHPHLHECTMRTFFSFTNTLHTCMSQSRTHSLTTTDNDNDNNDNKHKPISLLWLSGGFIMIQRFDKNIITCSCTQGSMQRLCMLAALYLVTTTQRHCLKRHVLHLHWGREAWRLRLLAWVLHSVCVCKWGRKSHMLLFTQTWMHTNTYHLHILFRYFEENVDILHILSCC